MWPSLVLGVLFGSAITPPVRDLIQRIRIPRRTRPADNTLATIISSLAKDVFGESLGWSLIVLGAAIGIEIVITSELLTRTT
ncbi:hypothetical protein [Mycolicibacterium porcinum]